MKKILLILILCTGCLDFDQAIGSVEETACDNLDPSEFNDQWDKDHCFKDAALRKNDPETCAKIQRNAPQTKCYMELAEKLGNPSICQKMNKIDSDAYTQAQCIYQVAVDTKNPETCEMMGSKSHTPFFGTPMNIDTCYEAIGVQRPSIQTVYEEKSNNFQYCYDIVYTHLHNEAPPKRTGNVDVKQEKNQIYEDLKENSYSEVKKGHVTDPSQGVSLMGLKDGDVVMFEFDDYPDPENSAHYAVVQDGKLWQIVNWKQGGALDGPRPPEFFFQERTLTNPYTQKTMTSPRVYKYYSVFRKNEN